MIETSLFADQNVKRGPKRRSPRFAPRISRRRIADAAEKISGYSRRR
jgi:hypothetical protein